MKEAIFSWTTSYPKAPEWKDGSFSKAPVARLVRKDVPNAIRRVLGAQAEKYTVKGSAGQSDWAHAPWVALLDRSETASVQEGLYIVYLLSHGCERFYLTLMQGCTSLRNAIGEQGAKQELIRRAEIMRGRLGSNSGRLAHRSIDLSAEGWRATLYEHGAVVAKLYDANLLEQEEEMIADLQDALIMYRNILRSGGWEPEDALISEAEQDTGNSNLQQAKVYRQHRRIERSSKHSKEVKKRQGTRCKGCETELSERYGSVADQLIDAHHLVPLANLADGDVVGLDPCKDFAVLCPNCHRVIHRMDDPSDIDALRSIIRAWKAQTDAAIGT